METDLAELIIQLDHDRPSHILVPAIHRNRAEIRALFERTIAARRAAARGARGAGRDRPPLPARALPERADGRERRELRRGRDGLDLRRRVRGQRPLLHHRARHARHGHGDREGARRVARPRGDAPAPAALLDRRADEPVHVDLDRRPRGRRAARVPPDPARRRPHAGARGRGRAARRCAASAARRASTSARSTRAPAGTPTARSTRARSARSSRPSSQGLDSAPTLPVRLEPLRRLLRGLPGEDRHPARCSCTCAGAWCASTRTDGRAERATFRLLARLFASRRRYEAAQRLARLGRGPLTRLPFGPLGGWTSRASCPSRRRRASATGGGTRA